MDSIKLNITSKISGIDELNFVSATIIDDNIKFIFSNTKDLYDLNIGDTLILKRYFGSDNNIETISDEIKLIDIIFEEKAIITEQPFNSFIAINKSYSANTVGNDIIINLEAQHNIFLHDLQYQRIKFYNIQREEINNGEEYEVGLIFKREDIEVTSGDCIVNFYNDISCNDCDEDVIIYEYEHTPEKISRTSLIIKELTEIPENAAFIRLKFSPYYYINDSNIIFWEDNIFNNFESTACNKYVRKYKDNVILAKDNSYWRSGYGFSLDADDSTLGMEDGFQHEFVEDLKESIVPDIIDMEKYKFSPIIKSGDTTEIATAITLNFHFRKRKEIIDDDRHKQNSTSTSGNVYYDSWYVNPDEEEITWWNKFEYSGTSFNEDMFTNFIEKQGKKSDLIGFLNFTDNDVYFRKKKISESFVRLLFYNSTDPIEQKLLFYSTVFLDGGELYGKYIKQLMDIKENRLSLNKGNQNQNCTVVLTEEGNNRVDTKLTITNEFNRSKSSEGFNIYLFADDYNLVNENTEKTIYMKVEFNHAGNGKTIPMIMWPKDGDKYCPLTTNNFINSLYIPVKTLYLNERYVYYIPNAINNDGNIELILFEPKLDMIPDKNINNDGNN